MVYPENGVLLRHKKEWSTVMCYNINELWKHVKWKMPDTKGHILYHAICMKCSK